MVPFIVGSLNDGSAIFRPGVESNPHTIGVMVGGGLTWGSRLRVNLRLREVSPAGKFSGARGVCWCELQELATESLDQSSP